MYVDANTDAEYDTLE